MFSELIEASRTARRDVGKGLVSVGIAGLICLGHGRLAQAQLFSDSEPLPGWSITPGFRAAGVYDDNLFFTPVVLERTAYLRLSPRIESRYSGPRHSFSAGYTFDSEVYPRRLDALTRVFARQRAAFDLESKLTSRSTLFARADYLNTRRPDEILDDTGLLSRFQPSQSFVVAASFDRRLTPRYGWKVGYELRLLDLGELGDPMPASSGVMHELHTGLTLSHTPRTASGFDYRFQLYLEEESFRVGSSPVFTRSDSFASHVATYSWARKLTPRTTFSILAGPRLSETLERAEGGEGLRRTRDWLPEVLASLRHRGRWQDFALTFTSSQFQAFGLTGFVNTRSLVLTMNVRPSRNWRLAARPGVYKNTRVDLDTVSWRLDAAVSYQITRWASLDALYRFHYQMRDLLELGADPSDAPQSRKRSALTIGVSLSRSFRVD